MRRSVLTIATGKPIYWSMAMELARSFRYWHKGTDIKFSVITDMVDATAIIGVDKILISPGELGNGFSTKLHLDRFVTSGQTLFIDADCLCVRPLDSVFTRFKGKSVSVVGGTIADGEWFGDVRRTCELAGVPCLPKFNGGIYYLESGKQASRVYERARQLLSKYDEMGLVRLRGLQNDELLMAIAMAQENCWGIEDDGTIMGEFLSTPKVVQLDTVLGKCALENPPSPDPRHYDGAPLSITRPAVIHFLGHHVSGWLYRSEVLRIRLAYDLRFPPILASMIGTCYRWPFILIDAVKGFLRPGFHFIFGARRVTSSRR